jgi:formiminotetrahydrofolate cyclodeaminase
MMSDSIWTAPLATFCDRVASLDPVPAGVSAAAVSATLGLALLAKVLEIASKRKDFSGDRELTASLLHQARNQSQILVQLAEEDIVVYRRYLDALRRKESIDEARRKTIEIPLTIARTSASGIALCGHAAGLIHAALAPDLVTARALLAAAVESTLSTVDANLKQFPSSDPYGELAAAEARELLKKHKRPQAMSP